MFDHDFYCLIVHVAKAKLTSYSLDRDHGLQHLPNISQTFAKHLPNICQKCQASAAKSLEVPA